MSLIPEFRRRASHIVGPVLAALIVGYFIYHMVQGDRGLLAWASLRQQVSYAEQVLVDSNHDRAKLEARVAQLHPDRIDADLLDEQARLVLGFSRPEDRVILSK